MGRKKRKIDFSISKKIKKVIQWCGVLFIIFGLIPYTAQAVETNPDPERITKVNADIHGPIDPGELEAFLDGVMAAHMASYHIAGAALVVVKDGKIFFARGYGYSDVENKKPVIAEETLFRTGSAGKLFTWTAVMQLVEQGKLDLRVDVNDYLKEFKIPDTYPEPITLTHLLTHTAGFEDFYCGVAARNAEEIMPLGKFLAENMPSRIYPPGIFTAYSNYGTALAGYIVELISGIPFEDYVEQHIFEPLDMHQSTFRQPLPSKLADNMAVCYTYEKGRYWPNHFELFSNIAPTGMMSTTATDMAKFMITHLENGKYENKRILREETARLMHSRLFSHDPRVSGNAYGFWERHYNNLSMIMHTGDIIYFHTLLILIPEKNIGFYVSYNGDDHMGQAREQLMQAFINRYYPVPTTPDPTPTADFKERASQYTGSYGMTRRVSTTFEKLMNLMLNVKVSVTDDEKLMTTMPLGVGTTQWVEVEPLVFHELGGQNTLVFKKDSQGHITNAFLSQFQWFACFKLSWYETPLFHFSLLAVFTILFLSTLVWPIRALFRLLCKREKKKEDAPRSARWLSGMMGILYLFFLFGLVIVFSNIIEFFYGVPHLFKVILVFPLLSTVLTIGVLIFTFLAWKNKYWSVCGRLHYTLVALASLAFLWFLDYWNLLGFHF
jgi:CubicO group peptidase (beta-lactamase class C family)